VELIGVLFMIAAGGVIAVAVMIAIGVAQRNAEPNPIASTTPDRSRIAASILFHLLLAGGAEPDEALRALRRAGVASPVTTGIDVASWGDRFAHLATAEQKRWLLETAVQLVAAFARPVPVRQYAVLLDLNFSLGFQTDALAKLREQYGFDYIDHAKEGRPREADRGGGAVPLFVRGTGDTTALLEVLGIEGAPDRQTIISAYRRLAAQIHPDRVHGQPADVQSEAAARFIEITRAYEALMALYGD
jgi:DnaJ-domain-containing protein 1